MAKKKIEKVEAKPDSVWGYGFRQIGPKWAAHRIDLEGNRIDITPPGGVHLHRAIAQVHAGLAAEKTRMARAGR